ncbi:unnamed protein product [Owenia fusiformis]|uniref:Uncharacterized protein n=1 Tax=Owenia fusiformis TaxID=6347 RepID=A0A8J1Y0E0_OWEFU|nr:unnamed protein product [Owenia fusiformis]
MADEAKVIRVDSEISMTMQKPTNSDADSVEIEEVADGDQHVTVGEHGDDNGCTITDEEVAQRLDDIQQWKAELLAEENKLLSRNVSANNTPGVSSKPSETSNRSSSLPLDQHVHGGEVSSPPVPSMPSVYSTVGAVGPIMSAHAPLVVSTPRSLLNFVTCVNTRPVNTVTNTFAAAVNRNTSQEYQRNSNPATIRDPAGPHVMSNPGLHRSHPNEIPLVQQTPLLPVSAMQPLSRKEHKVRPYNGTSSWRTFKFSFDTIADINGWDDQRRAVELLTCLEGDAQKVYEIIEPSRKLDYHYVSSCLNDLYNPNHQEEKYRNQLRKRLKKKGESVNSLGYDILRLANLGYGHLPEASRDQLALDAFKHALKTTDSQMSYHIFSKAPTTMREAIDSALQMEGYAEDTVVPIRATIAATSDTAQSSEPDQLTPSAFKDLAVRLTQFLDRKPASDKRCFYCNIQFHQVARCRIKKDDVEKGRISADHRGKRPEHLWPSSSKVSLNQNGVSQ